MRILPLVPLCGCIINVLPLTHNFSDEPTDVALSLTIDALDESNSFTDWKRLDWDVIHERVAEEEDWDRTLRLLVEAIPDGNVLLENEDGRPYPEAAGSVGRAVQRHTKATSSSSTRTWTRSSWGTCSLRGTASM